MSKPPFRRTEATMDVLRQLIDGEEHYALQVINAIGRPTGTVVPILRRLEKYGWVTGRWEGDSTSHVGPRRRYYQLTHAHLERARKLISSWGARDTTTA